MFAPFRRAVLAGTALSVLATALPESAQAWKPKTHVYLAEEAVRDAADDGRVTIYEVDYTTGKIIGVLGTFEADPRIVDAIRRAPKQFRAGVLGPDAYPDIATGQQVIHPEAAHAIDGHAPGSNAWLTHLWKAGIAHADPRVRAFTIGYLQHAAGDVFAHTYVNHYSGGEFQITPDPTNGIKHIVLEGYMGKRTPTTVNVFPKLISTGKVCDQRKRDDQNVGEEECGITQKETFQPVSFQDTSIEGVETFIYDQLIRADPGSELEAKLLQGDGTSRSVPAIFSRLRNGLVADVAQYDVMRQRAQSGNLDAMAWVKDNMARAEYKRAWYRDIDQGLRAWPATSHKVATAMVFTDPAGGDPGAAKAAIGEWAGTHLAKMSGVPDVVVATTAFISSTIAKFLPPPMREFLSYMGRQPLEAAIGVASGKSVEEWSEYASNPENKFDDVLNRGGGASHGGTPHQTTLERFNRDQLKIDDTGYTNAALRWKVEDVPAAFNTLQLNKMAMLSPQGMAQLAEALKAKGAAPGTMPLAGNMILGWVASLDAGNQMQAADAAHRPAFSQNGGAAYRKLFLPMLGEQPWSAADMATSTPSRPLFGRDIAGRWRSQNAAAPLMVDFVATGDNGVQAHAEITHGSKPAPSITGELEPDGPLLGGDWIALAEPGRFGGTLSVQAGADADTIVLRSSNKAALLGQASVTLVRVGAVPSETPPAETPPAPTPVPVEAPATVPVTPPPSAPMPVPSPAPVPIPSPSPVPVTSPLPTAPASAGGSTENFNIALDRAVVDRVGEIDVTLAVSNLGNTPRAVNTSALHLFLEDADGLEVENVAPLEPGDGPPAPFSPTIAAGGTVRVRYRIAPLDGGAPLRRLTVRENASGPVVRFDMSGLSSSRLGSAPAPTIGNGGFVSLEDFDIRLDRLVQLPGGETEIFFTMRNMTNKPDGTGGGEFVFRATGANGEQIENARQVFPARGTPRPRRAHSTLYIEPGGTAHLRTFFDGRVTGPITITDWKVTHILPQP